MKQSHGRLSVSPTDLANFLACRHKTTLDRLVALGELAKPFWVDPLAEVLRDRGLDHERRYVDGLRASGLRVVDLSDFEAGERRVRTLDAMRDGADVIVQAVLADDRWFGYADVLRRVATGPSALGEWSYEVHDTKLSRETRGGTILQLCVYSDLLKDIQQHDPEYFRVVTPVAIEAYRTSDFAAFYRQVKARFLEFVDRDDPPPTYPEPVEHCDVCRWWSACTSRRRTDDHLTFVAGLGRLQQSELVGRGVKTLAALADLPLPVPFKPGRGSRETYERLREQARLQATQRRTGDRVYELLPIEEEFGLTQLPEPRPGDLFLDLEGDPFGRDTAALEPGAGGREYLFGLGRAGRDGAFDYSSWWAFTDAEERAAFDAVMSAIMAALDVDPAIHVYHYAPYEPAAFKRLMGRYALREADVDRLLRGERFVDLYAIVRHTLRAGIERYSIKDLEPFCGFQREVVLDDAGAGRRLIELALERRDPSTITPDVRATVEGYNRDDCRSVLALRNWLETLRDAQIAQGHAISRPPLEPDEPTEDVSARQQRVNDLRARLLTDVPVEARDRTPEQQARWLLAYLLDWHYREDKVAWWEYYRLLELSDDELLDEPAAVAGLELVVRLGPAISAKTGKPTRSVVDRYRYPQQEFEIRRRDNLMLRDESTFGEVVAVDRAARTLDVQKGPSVADTHPPSAFVHDRVSPEAPAAALYRLGEVVADGGLAALPSAAQELLLRRTAARVMERPVFRPAGSSVLPLLTIAETDESVVDFAIRVAGDLDGTTLPIQGPPGSGKTYTGARMIVELVTQGKRVGVTATGHKVIRHLLNAVAREAAALGRTARLGHKVGEPGDSGDGVLEIEGNSDALTAIGTRQIDVLGGTAWLWSRPEFAGAVDVLFIDEAGQMSLANALAVSQAASGIVLLGDPQQLEQPQRGSHPDGVGVSALDHILEGHPTMPADRGLFLPVTWRLSPQICAFTSDVFYEGKLHAKPGLERQRLAGTGRFTGSGLFVIDVAHEGCRNASDDEVAVVAAAVAELLNGTVWIDEHQRERALTIDDILIVAPYNAQVSRLQERLPGHRVGTVDKFQGQEAPVVIYSMTTSSPDDAPRGMEFLYSLNRLNVATSRAKCVCIVVANPRLYEPDCRTPRQMTLANALARYRELARGC